MKKFIPAILIVLLLPVLVLAQGLSPQVLALLSRDNYWSGTNTFSQTAGIVLENGPFAPITSTTDRLYNVNHGLYFNGVLIGGGSVTAVTAGTGISVTGTATAPVINLGTFGGGAGTCTDCNLTVDAYGRISVYSSGAGGGGVPSSRTITTTTPVRIDGGASADLSANRTLSLANSGVIAGTYPSPNDGTYIPQCTYNAIGLATSCTSVAVAPNAATHHILSVTHTDTVAASVVRGDLMIGNSTPQWQRLAIGSAGSFVTSNGTDVSWGVNGAALTTLNATNISSGTLADARLSGNVLLQTYVQTTNGDSLDALRDVHPGLLNPGHTTVSTGQNWTFETDTNNSKITLAINNRGNTDGFTGADTVPTYTSNGGKWSGIGPTGFARLQLQAQSEGYNSGGSSIGAAGADQVAAFTLYPSVWHGTINGAGGGTFTAGACGTDSAGATHCPNTFEIVAQTTHTRWVAQSTPANFGFVDGGGPSNGSAALVSVISGDYTHVFSSFGWKGMEIEQRSYSETEADYSNMVSAQWPTASIRVRNKIAVGCGVADGAGNPITSFSYGWSRPAALCVQPPQQVYNGSSLITNPVVYGAEIWGPEAAQSSDAAALRLTTEDTANSALNYGLVLQVNNLSVGANVVGIYAATNVSSSAALLMRLRGNTNGGPPSSSLDSYDALVVNANGGVHLGNITTTPGPSGQYLCIDSNGNLYRKASCP